LFISQPTLAHLRVVHAAALDEVCPGAEARWAAPYDRRPQRVIASNG
jgi:hypothetical protein